MMEYAFYFMLKVIIFKIIKYFGHAGKRYDKRAKFNFKIYDVTGCITNNYKKHIYQYVKKQKQ